LSGRERKGYNAMAPEEPDAAYLRYENWARPGLRGIRGGNSPVLSGPNLAITVMRAAPGNRFSEQAAYR
jgi:hypothetical protein